MHGVTDLRASIEFVFFAFSISDLGSKCVCPCTSLCNIIVEEVSLPVSAGQHQPASTAFPCGRCLSLITTSS